MKVGSLFSGIGGMDLGLERAGMSIQWQVENDDYSRHVLKQHWPTIPLYGDITKLDVAELSPVDVLCGGFPCNDISRAGTREGIEGKQSGLWSHFYRVVCDLRPPWVLVENSSILTGSGLATICSDLASLGYDAEWDCLPAAAFGAPHIRDRLYLLAYPCSSRRATPDRTVFAGWSLTQLHGGWTPEPDVDRMAYGFSPRVDRVRCLGNAVVPRVTEWIGKRILDD